MMWVPLVLPCSLWHPLLYRGIIKAQRGQIICSLLCRDDLVLNLLWRWKLKHREIEQDQVDQMPLLVHSHSKEENHCARHQLYIRPWLCPRPWLSSKYIGYMKDQEPRVVGSVGLSQLSIRLIYLRFRKPLDSTCDNYRIPTYIDKQ